MLTVGRSFPKANRLTRRHQFLRVKQLGRSQVGRFFVVVWARGDTGSIRLGITVSRRVANSVGRNRIKRLVREAFRHCRPQLATAMDVVVIARPPAARLDGPSILAEVTRALTRAVPKDQKDASPRG